MKPALAVVLCVSGVAAATMAAAAPVPDIVGYQATLTGRTEASGNVTVNVLDPTGPVAMQVQMTFAGLDGGMAGVSFHFTDSGADLPATLGLPGPPVGEEGGDYRIDFYLDQPGRSLLSPEYVTRFGAGTAPFLSLLQGGALSMVVATGEFPAGEIRGTLTPALSAVPLPPALAPMLVALAGLGVAGLRRRRRG
jgi:hypothetical protein